MDRVAGKREAKLRAFLPAHSPDCQSPTHVKENKRMKVLKILRGLTAKNPPDDPAEMRSIIIMLRKSHQFSEEELQAAAERAWGKKFDGKEDPMYFVSAGPTLTVVKAGRHVIRVTSVPTRFADDDEYALAQLPRPEQKKAWTEHSACASLDFLNDLRSTGISDAEAYSSMAKLALQLGDPNCAAIFIPIKNMMMPNDGAAEQGLRMLIDKELPMRQ